jgi:hypothetical protein
MEKFKPFVKEDPPPEGEDKDLVLNAQHPIDELAAILLMDTVFSP